MELIFVGTGAGELWPSVFCPCEACQDAIRQGGASRRIGACMLVDRQVLFDIPPNCGLAALEQGVSLAELTHLVVTHSHQDHLDPCVLAARGRNRERPLHLYCNRHVAKLLPIYQQFNRFFDPEALGLRIHTMEPGQQLTAHGTSWTLTALLADHDSAGGETPLIFILEKEQHCILYACDTGWIPEESWAIIAEHEYDAVVLDCTFHLERPCRQGHLGMEAFVEQKRRFEQERLLKPSAQFVAQHIHRGHGQAFVCEAEIAAQLAKHDVILARDGMRLTW